MSDLILDAGDDLGVEQRNHGSDQEGTEDDGDDNLDTFGDVEIAVFVVESFLCGVLQILSLEVCLGGESSDSVCHSKNPFVLKKMYCCLISTAVIGSFVRCSFPETECGGVC